MLLFKIFLDKINLVLDQLFIKLTNQLFSIKRVINLILLDFTNFVK